MHSTPYQLYLASLSSSILNSISLYLWSKYATSDQIQPFTYAFLLPAGNGSGNPKDTEKVSTDSSMLDLPGMTMSVNEAR